MGSRDSPSPPSATSNPTGAVDGTSTACPSGPADFTITAQTRIVKKSGAPIQITAADAPGCSGGTFAWTTASTKITLTNGGSATVTVQGLAQVSASRDAEVITVTRTQAGVAPVTKTVNVTVAEVTFSKATTQRYGYDDFDTPANPADDHVSIKKSDHSFVHVDITGGALGDDFDFVCDDNTVCTAVAPGANASFDLRLDAGNKNKNESPLHAKVKSPSRESFASIAVDVYAEKAVSAVVAKVHDSRSATTALRLPGLNPAGAHLTRVNDKLKEGVVHFDITTYDPGGATTDIRFDLDSNGALSFDINAGGGPELAAIGSAMTGTGTSIRVVVVRALRSYYYLSAAVAVGATTLSVRGSSVFKYPVGQVALGLGADSEMVTVSNVAGTTITLSAGVTKAHAVGTPIEFPATGWSSNPIIIAENTDSESDILGAIPHEVAHRALTLADVTDRTNCMHFERGRTDFRLRYCPRTLRYSAGTENQWEKIPR
jgi:hypothetical protein